MDYFQFVRRVKDGELQDLTTKIQSEHGLTEVVQKLHLEKMNIKKTKKKKSSKVKQRPIATISSDHQADDSGEGKDSDKQIEDFKLENRRQIKLIQKGSSE